MKKVVRTVWISLLSGLAFLVACTSQNGLTRAEKKQLKAERADLVNLINGHSLQDSKNRDALIDMKHEELYLRNRLNEIDLLLGNKTSIDENNRSISILQADIDSLESARQFEIDSIRKVMEEAQKPKPCVYGPPR